MFGEKKRHPKANPQARNKLGNCVEDLGNKKSLSPSFIENAVL